MYKHAAYVLGKDASEAEFRKAYTEGRYHFTEDPSLLNDLLLEHSLRMQMLGDEWLASTEKASAYGKTPIEAACRFVVASHFS